MENKVERLKLLNMEWPYFLVFACIVWAAVQFVFLPKSLAGQISFLLVLGEALNFIGNRTPIVKDYLGGGSIVVLFGSSALVMFGLIPKEVVKETNTFITATLLNYALAALCCGSIFGMDRNILVKASLRYIPCILGGAIGAAVLSGLIGTVVMGSLEETLFFITLPIMGGGASAGAVPMSQMFAEILKKDAGTLLAIMTPAVALGVGLIKLQDVLAALTPMYIIVVAAVVIGAIIGSGFVGRLVGFYPIEAAITGGLCMANMGGSGDIATLGATKRMELMPFAAVSSRLGGALMQILGSFLLALFV